MKPGIFLKREPRISWCKFRKMPKAGRFMRLPKCHNPNSGEFTCPYYGNKPKHVCKYWEV